MVGAPGVAAGDLTFSSVTLLNLRLFDNLGQQGSLAKHYPWLRGVRLTLSVNNLLDQHVDVRGAGGATPLSYQAGYIDPLGRAIVFNARKLFF